MMRSLYFKFTLTTIVIICLSTLSAFLISNTYYQQKIKPYNDQKNTKIALEIARFAKTQSLPELQAYLEHIAALGYQFYLVDEQGQEYFFGAPFKEATLPASTLKHVFAGEIYHGMALFPQETFVTGFFANQLTNSIGVPLQVKEQNYALFMRPDIKLLFSEVHTLLAWLIVLTLVFSIVLVIISTKFLIEPITKLTLATKDIAEGNFAIKLAIDRSDELGGLAQSFTQMASKLEKVEEMRKEFISNISHDLQSPLATIQGYTKLLEKESLDQDKKREYLQVINGEAKRLSRLTKQYLLLASLDQNEEVLNKRNFNLGEQLKELIGNYQWLVNERGIMISYSLPDLQIYADPALLYIVWENLLTNAIKYNKENGEIQLTVLEREQGIEVIFEDTGLGLDELEMQRLFERFYRVDSARSRAVEGTGLGLSIALMIVHMHEGRIEVTSEKNKGSRFIVSLPNL